MKSQGAQTPMGVRTERQTRVVDIGIILSVRISLKDAIWWAAGIGVLVSILILVISRYSDSKSVNGIRQVFKATARSTGARNELT